MNTSRIIRRAAALAAAGGLAVTGIAVAANSAAADGYWVYTGDASPGGRANFISHGDKIRACELQADDSYALAKGLLWERYSGGYIEDVTEETVGDCDSDGTPEVPESWRVMYRAFLAHRGDSRLYFGSGYGYACADGTTSCA